MGNCFTKNNKDDKNEKYKDKDVEIKLKDENIK